MKKYYVVGVCVLAMCCIQTVRAQLFPMVVQRSGTTMVPGVVGAYARHFEPSDCWDFGNHFAFQPGDSFGVSFWINMDAAQGTSGDMGQILGWYANDSGWNVDTGFQIPFAQPYIGFNMALNAAGVDGIGIRNNVSFAGDGLWHYVVCTYNGNGRASGMSMYIDGAIITPVVTQDYDLSGQTIPVAKQHFTLGRGFGYTDNPDGDGLAGSLDEVCIYNRVLTAAEISSLYTHQLSNQPPLVINGLVQEMNFEASDITINATAQVSAAYLDQNATASRMILTVVTSGSSQSASSNYLTINFAPQYVPKPPEAAPVPAGGIYPVFSQYGTNSLNGIARFGMVGTGNSIVVSTMGIPPSANSTYQFVIHALR